ncbi:hypothetical protein RIF23_01365 [Lipingzhangella sp. LS1_29]|uniref:Uncharacterized protein n=1 Tax=Lipingzhangella rawalii TaxID=2055835 RepID=A0ABU2H0V2_9ACTN|nr:hypothetical protein [Lipingzhangella rawalii]MDS1268936.1 hypothetical protein [Lipingzhangella rawalii]
MRRIAVTGHRALPTTAIPIIARHIRRHLRERAQVLSDETRGPTGLTGLSCLADGADTLFATELLALGGSLEVIVPARTYRDELPDQHHPRYDELLAQATHVHRLAYPESTPQAHLAASQYMVDHAEELVAVWDGLPARGPGGTADVVAYAHRRQVPVTVIWPEGTVR